MALVPDALVNPTAEARTRLPDVLAMLEQNGYGLLQLPPPDEHSLLLAVIADQVAEYAHHGYAVVAIGLRGQSGDGLHWRGLAALLRNRGITPPPRHVIQPAIDRGSQEQRLAKFLADYDLPPDEQVRWRAIPPGDPR